MLLMHRLGRLAVRAGSGVALLAVVAGVPAGLVTYIGWPLPQHLPTSWDQIAAILTGGFPDTAVVGLLAVALWLVWAAFAQALVVELAAARRGQPARRIRLISPMQALAALLVAGLAAGPAAASAAVIAPAPTVAPYTAAHAGGSQTGQAVSPVAAWPSHLSTPRGADAAPRALPTTAASPTSLNGVPTDLPRFALAAHGGPLTVTAAGTQYTVIVQHGDTLWDLAQAWLGNPHRWTEIYHLNADRYDGNGRLHHGEDRMQGGDHIEPTWHLILPDDATPPAGAKPRTFIPPAATRPATPPVGTTPTSPHATAPTPTPSTTTQPSAPAPSAAPSDTPGDDGVIGGAPASASPSATASPHSSTSAATSATATATPQPAAPQSHRPSPPGVSLTGNSWIDLGLAVAIAAAATVVWRLRRRRYTPRPPSAHVRLDDPDLAPLPEVVTRVRRALRTPTAPDADDSLHDNLIDDDSIDDEFDDSEVSDPDPLDDEDEEPEATDPPPLNMPALGNPMLTAWPPAGLGLTGAGAEAAARGFLASALAAGGVEDPHGRSSVVLPAATLATLLGAAAVNVPDTPRLTVTGDLTEALELLEEHTLHRTRLVYGHEVDTVTELREADPYEEPLPPILLLADATVSHERARITALLAQGQRLDIHGVLLGEWPDGDTVVVAGDGTTTPAGGEGSRHGSHPADVGRLAVITAAEAAALLPTLAESHTGLPQPAAPAEPQPRTTAATVPPVTVADELDQAADGADDAAQPAAVATTSAPIVDAPSAVDETDSPTVASTDDLSSPVQAGAGPDDEDGPDPDDDDTADGPGVVAVQVLGRPAIVDADPQQPLRAKAMELLVYLIARDGVATIDAIIEDLVPDATMSKAPNRIHTYIYALRKALRRTGGRATYITHPRHRYQLSRAALDVDLWRMQEALAEAETTGGTVRLAALRRAVACYRGPLAEGARYEWAEPYREAVRRQALDAHLALAEALSDQPEEALAVLDAAIARDPYAEQLYQAAMRRHADLDDPDAITARLAQLTHRLEELDAEPTDETTELAGALTDDLRRRARRNPGAAA